MAVTGELKVAFLITDRDELGAELSEGLGRAGFATETVASFEILETQADSRPELVITDLHLQPTETQWSALVRMFPHSVLWALVDPDAPEFSELVTAFRHGCEDCLLYPVADRALIEKAEVVLSRGEVVTGRLDRYITNEIRLDIPSDLSMVQPVVDLLASRCREYRGYVPRTLIKLRIAVSEALANAIHYGNQDQIGKSVKVRASVDAWDVTVRVTDEGSGFDPERVPDPTLPAELESPTGRGIFLLRQLADEVTFNEKGNSVTIVIASDQAKKKRPPATPFPAIDERETVIELFERGRRTSGLDLHLWERRSGGELLHLAPADSKRDEPRGLLRWLRTNDSRYAVEVEDEDELAARWAEFTRELLETTLDYERKLEEKGREVAERRDEVELLHAVTETLGAVTRIEEAAGPVLREVVRVTDAERASLWIHDPASDELVLMAAEGPSPAPVNRIPVNSGWSISALAFRENRTVRLDEGDDLAPQLFQRYSPKPDPWIVVPVLHTDPDGESKTIGVLNLIGRRSGSAISDLGDTRLLTTLARQIGSAVENMRLFEEVLERERLIGELKLAQNLQVGLLPDLAEFEAIADVAARCVPAETVGGDFYQMFRLPEDKIGVMLGDITSHGFGASLIMALFMSATGIYARETPAPADLLRAIHRALIGQLESTETFVTVFYGVISPADGTLSYTNAGHGHAFRLHGDDPPQRLDATNAPLGVAEHDDYVESVVPWQSDDLLGLFTDGLTTPDFRNSESELVQILSRLRDRPAAAIIEELFEERGRQSGEAPDDQTALALRLRSPAAENGT